MVLTLLGGLLACGGPAPDPELEAIARAREAFARGESALASGDPVAARSAFVEAAGHHADPILAAWEGSAAAAAGDHAGAEVAYRRALAADPSLAAARWAFALELARGGRHAEAGPELARSLADGAGVAVDVRLDPDWAPFLDDPVYAFVPAAVVGLTTSAAPPTTFWGSEVAVTLTLAGRPGPSVAWDAPVTGPATLVRVTEEVRGDQRSAEVVFRVTGAGLVTLGPFSAATAGTVARADAVTTAAAAPPGREVAPPTEPWPPVDVGALTSGAAVVNGVTWIPIPASGARVTTTPERPQITVRQRRGDEVRAWQGVLALPSGSAVTVGREPPFTSP